MKGKKSKKSSTGLHVLVINGPNLNMLGERDRAHYGFLTLSQINNLLKNKAKRLGAKLSFFQSNHEGEIIDFIQENATKACGILINPAALTHYGYSLRDALKEIKLPTVEVHLSDIKEREDFRKINVLKGIPICRIIGLKEKSYLLGLEKLVSFIKDKKP